MIQTSQKKNSDVFQRIDSKESNITNEIGLKTASENQVIGTEKEGFRIVVTQYLSDDLH